MIEKIIEETFVNKELKDKRYSICKSCDRFKKPNKICEMCLCFMPAKTKLVGAECPTGKW